MTSNPPEKKDTSKLPVSLSEYLAQELRGKHIFQIAADEEVGRVERELTDIMTDMQKLGLEDDMKRRFSRLWGRVLSNQLIELNEYRLALTSLYILSRQIDDLRMKLEQKGTIDRATEIDERIDVGLKKIDEKIVERLAQLFGGKGHEVMYGAGASGRE